MDQLSHGVVVFLQFVGGLLSAKMLAGVEVAVEFWLALGHKSSQPQWTHMSDKSDVIPNEVCRLGAGLFHRTQRPFWSLFLCVASSNLLEVPLLLHLAPLFAQSTFSLASACVTHTLGHFLYSQPANAEGAEVFGFCLSWP